MRIKQRLFILPALFSAAVCFAAEKPVADALLEAARNGDEISQLKVADQYFFGRNNRKADSHLAAYWFRKAADNGNARAQFNYGVCCLKGWGVPASPQTGFLWISKAAAQELEAAMIMQAELLFSGLAPELDPARRFPAMSADVNKSLEILRKLSGRGSALAAKSLARLLLKDPELRTKYAGELRKNAVFSAGKLPRDVECVLIYATVLQNGIGGDTDLKKAVQLLHSIEDISPEAMARLSEIYNYGFAVQQDCQKAFDLCQRAAELGSPRAQLALGMRYLEGDMVEHSPARAFELFRSSWHGGYPAAAAALGKCFLEGIGTQQDMQKAFEFFMQGANAGDPESQYRLGKCFLDGAGTDKDSAGAIHWFRTAAKSGHADAERELGIAMIEGRGTEINKSEGIKLLQTAASKGDIQSIEYLNGARNQ